MKISEFAESVTPYTAGEQPFGVKIIKLNTNENPYPPAPECAAALKNFDAGSLRLYPNISAERLRAEIANAEGVKKENIFVGNGSDEVLSLLFRTLFDPHASPVVFPSVTYSFYPVFCAMYGIEYRTVENEADFSVDVKKLGGGQGVVIANPNAPTSLALSLEEIEELLRAYDGKPVVVDEAYIDFATETSSAVELLSRHENLIVVKTFSKSYSLAGMRLGYAVASEFAVSALERVRDCFNSYPVDSVCQAVGAAAVAARDYHRATVEKVIATRERMRGELLRMGRIVPKSQSNFLLVSGGRREYEMLKSHGILIRWFSSPRIKDYTRVTVGTDEDMDAYLHALLMR